MTVAAPDRTETEPSASPAMLGWVGRVVPDRGDTHRASFLVRALETRRDVAVRSETSNEPTETEVAPAAPTGASIDRENVAFVRSPSGFVPDLRFRPVPERRPFALGLSRRVPGRYLFAALILVAVGLWWMPWQSPPEVIVPSAVVIEGPPVSLVVGSNGVQVTGTVSSDAMHDEVMARVESMLGADNVLDQLVIDDGAVVDLTQPVPIELGDDVLFSVGQSEILAPYEPLVATAARMLLADRTMSLGVVGHTDSTGPSDANLRLSVRRAEAVRDALVETGVGVDQVVVDGRGEDEPVATNGTPEGRAENRRVEFAISGLLG